MSSTIMLALVKLDDGDKLLCHYTTTSVQMFDRVVCDTACGQKIGTVIAKAMVLKGSDTADLINQMNDARTVKPILCNISDWGKGEDDVLTGEDN